MLYQYEPLRLEGKAVLITGGTTGIGRSTAQRLVAAGANVLIFGRHEQELHDALTDIQQSGNGKVSGMTADSSKFEDLHRVFEEADRQLGGLDILINNAALAGSSVMDTDYSEWEYVVRTNLIGYMVAARLAADRMKAKGKGHIVVVGSLSAKERSAGSDVYVATKAGIQGFTEAFRKQVNEMGIRVSLIEPGLAGSDMTAKNTPVEEQPQKIEELKMMRSEDVAEAIYYTLIQPERCDIIVVQLRPHLQSI